MTARVWQDRGEHGGEARRGWSGHQGRQGALRTQQLWEHARSCQEPREAMEESGAGQQCGPPASVEMVPWPVGLEQEGLGRAHAGHRPVSKRVCIRGTGEGGRVTDQGLGDGGDLLRRCAGAAAGGQCVGSMTWGGPWTPTLPRGAGAGACLLAGRPCAGTLEVPGEDLLSWCLLVFVHGMRRRGTSLSQNSYQFSHLQKLQVHALHEIRTFRGVRLICSSYVRCLSARRTLIQMRLKTRPKWLCFAPWMC